MTKNERRALCPPLVQGVCVERYFAMQVSAVSGVHTSRPV